MPLSSKPHFKDLRFVPVTILGKAKQWSTIKAQWRDVLISRDAIKKALETDHDVVPMEI